MLFTNLCPVGVSCGKPGTSSNSNVEYTGIYFEDTAMYSCDAGYILNGTAVRMCQADGKWSGSKPKCEGQ